MTIRYWWWLKRRRAKQGGGTAPSPDCDGAHLIFSCKENSLWLSLV